MHCGPWYELSLDTDTSDLTTTDSLHTLFQLYLSSFKMSWQVIPSISLSTRI
jgi:hypothetical protein